MSLITEKEIEIVVSRAIGPNVKIVNHRLATFSENKTGILGSHYSLTIQVEDKPNATVKNYSFFLKTQPESSIVKDLILDEYTFFEEIHFFKEIYPQFIENYKGQKWSPKCYLVNKNTLIFEDLRSQGYTLCSDNYLEDTFLKSALSTLARYHASSVLVENKLGSLLKDVYPGSFEEKMFTEHNKFGKACTVGFITIAQMAEIFGFDSSIVSKIKDRVYQLVKYKKGRWNVVCHGDLWKNNIMFDSSVVPPKCILVDYQLLRYASPAVDIVMLLYLHTTPEFRNKFEYNMIDHYFTSLSEAIKESDRECDIPSYEKFLEDYNECRLVGMCYSAMYLPGIYLNPKEFTKLMNDPARLEKWFFQNRIEFITSSMQTDFNYKEKMREIVHELLNEGQRAFV